MDIAAELHFLMLGDDDYDKFTQNQMQAYMMG